MTQASPSQGAQRAILMEARPQIRIWLISVLLHALMLLLMFQFSWFVAARVQQREIPVALVDLGKDLKPSSLMAADEAFAMNPTEFSRETAIQPHVGQDLERMTSGQFGGLTSGQGADLDILTVGPGGTGLEDWGLSGGSGSGPGFFKVGGERAKGASRIVYVVDRSGSMLETFDAVKAEIVRSVGQLRLSQKFHVIFFSSGTPEENPPKRLVNATQSQKEALFQFLETVTPEGSTNPTEAMRRAFMVEPDLIFFLTDGAFQDTLLNHLRVWNSDHRVRIFTIAYEDPEGAALLERIALDHGGEYRFVRRDYRSP